MFCKKCGCQLREGATFCNQCGASQKSPQPTPAPTVEDDEKTITVFDLHPNFRQPVYQAPPVQPVSPQAQPQPQSFQPIHQTPPVQPAPAPSSGGKVKCPACAAVYDAGVRFCGKCGAKLPAVR